MSEMEGNVLLHHTRMQSEYKRKDKKIKNIWRQVQPYSLCWIFSCLFASKWFSINCTLLFPQKVANTCSFKAVLLKKVIKLSFSNHIGSHKKWIKIWQLNANGKICCFHSWLLKFQHLVWLYILFMKNESQH